MVGLLALCAVTVVQKYQQESAPEAVKQFQRRVATMPELMKSIHPTGSGPYGVEERGILALVNEDKLLRILTRTLRWRTPQASAG